MFFALPVCAHILHILGNSFDVMCKGGANESVLSLGTVAFVVGICLRNRWRSKKAIKIASIKPRYATNYTKVSSSSSYTFFIPFLRRPKCPRTAKSFQTTKTITSIMTSNKNLKAKKPEKANKINMFSFLFYNSRTF